MSSIFLGLPDHHVLGFNGVEVGAHGPGPRGPQALAQFSRRTKLVPAVGRDPCWLPWCPQPTAPAASGLGEGISIIGSKVKSQNFKFDAPHGTLACRPLYGDNDDTYIFYPLFIVAYSVECILGQ